MADFKDLDIDAQEATLKILISPKQRQAVEGESGSDNPLTGSAS
jgi:hypothetical protein